ncbi:hypothetical protein [Thiomicrorhabdus sp. Milos-T2]|uniref:hypothetical protein n=1 Tax=Thiomicrorhabdus sp. Milos-T2 TaxID=90814 RepID=UPI000494C817|nr:hypothetical protein [Thiomicrorhabdus sp. Milos-T2]
MKIGILTFHFNKNFRIVVPDALALGTRVLISDKVNIAREIEQMQASLVESDTLEGTQNLIQAW